MSGTVVFGIIVDPLSSIFGKSIRNVDSDPTRNRLECHLFVVIFVEVHKRSLHYLQTWRQNVKTIFRIEVARSWTKSNGLCTHWNISTWKMIWFYHSEHVRIVTAGWMGHIDVVLDLFDEPCATFFRSIARIIVSRKQFSEITYACQVIVLTEANVEIESWLFVNSLKKTSISITSLFEKGIGLLPVDISCEFLSHGLDEIHLIVEVFL